MADGQLKPHALVAMVEPADSRGNPPHRGRGSAKVAGSVADYLATRDI
jgi:hypothetical protein